jgi:hypothetical protein
VVVVALLTVWVGIVNRNATDQTTAADGDPSAIEERLHDDGVVDPAWSEPIDGLQFLLRADWARDSMDRRFKSRRNTWRAAAES